MYAATKGLMQKYDQTLIKSGYNIEQLVDLASDAILPHVEEYQSYAILVGPGNNGADALSLGIKLANKNKEVNFYLMTESEHRLATNRHFLKQVRQIGLSSQVVNRGNINDVKESLGLYDVIIDGIFGFGLSRKLEGTIEKLVGYINGKIENPVIAIDIPSGLFCNFYNHGDPILKAQKTVSLTALKQSFLDREVCKYTGKIVVANLATEQLHDQLRFPELIGSQEVVDSLKIRHNDDYKHKNGRVIHLTGCAKYRGAAVLAAKGSVYSGSGIVAVSSCEEVENALAANCSEVIFHRMTNHVDAKMLENYQAILVGSGLGISFDSINVLFDTLASAQVPVVVDGDGLTILAQRKEEMLKFREPLILTPHLGEFKRFCKVEDDCEISDVAIEFAEKFGVVLVLKGPNTIVTDGKRIFRNITGSREMATAGSGDVLAGVITSFLGQGYDPLVAATIGVYFHGLAGQRIGHKSYVALPSRVVEELPLVLKEFENLKK